jgi:hypothetical protein
VRCARRIADEDKKPFADVLDVDVIVGDVAN